MSLRTGDEAVLISLSFGVLLASVQGNFPPLPEDWRCSLLLVESVSDELVNSWRKKPKISSLNDPTAIPDMRRLRTCFLNCTEKYVGTVHHFVMQDISDLVWLTACATRK